MKQITIVLHYDDDDAARRVYEELNEIRKASRISETRGKDEPLDINLLTRSILVLKILGPND